MHKIKRFAMIPLLFLFTLAIKINAMEPPYPCAPGTLIAVRENQYPLLHDALLDVDRLHALRTITAREDRKFLGPHPLSYRLHTITQWYQKASDRTPLRRIEDDRIETTSHLTSLGLGIMMTLISGGIYVCYALYTTSIEPTDADLEKNSEKDSYVLS